MSATPALRGPQRVAQWPRITATVRADGTGSLTINGTEHACAAAGVDELRTGLIARCTAIAIQLGRPVRVQAVDGQQSWTVAVRPEGIVQTLSDAGTIEAADGYSVHEGRCRNCRRLQPVTAPRCAACGAERPHDVELIQGT